MAKHPLSGTNENSPPLRGRRKRFRRDPLVGILLLLVIAYGAAAFAMGSLQPVAPIATGSMEPAVKQGSLVLVKRVPPAAIAVGDVIVFTIPEGTRPAGYPSIRLAHRVVRVENDPAAGLVFWTKGDALDQIDSFGTPARLVKGEVVYSVPVLGYPWLFFQSREGFIFLGLVSLFYLTYRLEGPVRRWFGAISTGGTDPQLLERVDRVEETVEQFAASIQHLAEATSAYGTHLASHTKVMEGIAKAVPNLNQAILDLQEAVRDLRETQNKNT